MAELITLYLMVFVVAPVVVVAAATGTMYVLVFPIRLAIEFLEWLDRRGK
jgi:hypothetical protein